PPAHPTSGSPATSWSPSPPSKNTSPTCSASSARPTAPRPSPAPASSGSSPNPASPAAPGTLACGQKPPASGQNPGGNARAAATATGGIGETGAPTPSGGGCTQRGRR